ncbi:hypothetical protein GUJ93_ZPchr0004g38212 [Zizania palustris]|uniref:Uncharacterized protein n=1 Tax=Zizania palustris TaxID=103762 RepID=A0A8J5S6M5_ZIZPA|nr:hypothetical protein GUJ93_ZPchr0004g38212 [Zizania palustris]
MPPPCLGASGGRLALPVHDHAHGSRDSAPNPGTCYKAFLGYICEQLKGHTGIWKGVGVVFSPITAEMEPVGVGSKEEYLYDCYKHASEAEHAERCVASPGEIVHGWVWWGLVCHDGGARALGGAVPSGELETGQR